MISKTPAGLFDYPHKAYFGKVLPKSKVYTFAKVTRRLRDLFAKEVDQITWRYKLAPETINLPAGPGVAEIQVFGVELKPGVQELTEGLLQCIDDAIAFPIVFEVSARSSDGDRIQVVTAYKRPSEADSSKWVVEDYFSTGWLPTDTTRSPLPVALNLAGLYEQMLHQLMPIPARPGEPLQSLAERYRMLALKQRELEKLDAQLRKEKQFNRKVELNALVRAVRADVEGLTQ
jgi:hypothetical protein